MAPVRSPGDPMPRAAAPLPDSAWGPPPPDIAVVQGANGSSFRSVGPVTAGAVATIMFGSGSAKLDARDETVLRDVAELQRRSGGRISVVGHASASQRDRTDPRRQMANFSVSMDRANAVAQALQRYGVPISMIDISAWPETVALNEASSWRADVFLQR